MDWHGDDASAFREKAESIGGQNGDKNTQPLPFPMELNAVENRSPRLSVKEGRLPVGSGGQRERRKPSTRLTEKISTSLVAAHAAGLEGLCQQGVTRFC